MFDRLSRSWHLVKASASILRSDKELLVFPLVSSICTLLVAASFIAPLIGSAWLEQLAEKESVDPLAVALLFAFYLSQYFVIFFFNSALVGAALIRLRGGDPTVADGFRIAFSKIGPIFGYAAIAATVGLILRGIEQRAGWIGQIVAGMLGLAWTLASALVVPILVSQNIGPVDAVKRSAVLLKKTWGEQIAGNVGVGLVFGLLMMLIIFAGVALVGAMSGTGSKVAIVAAIAVSVAAVIICGLIHSALSGIYAAALYCYAETGQGAGSFDSALLGNAFKPKK